MTTYTERIWSTSGRAIYGGLWAEMLRDRKFAGNDMMYTAPSEGLHNIHPSIGIVVPWEAQNPDYEAVRYVHDNSTFSPVDNPSASRSGELMDNGAA